MDIIWATWLYNLYIIYLCSNLYTYLFMHLCERKKSFITFPTLLYLKLQTLIFNSKGTGWLVCNLVSFWCKRWEDLRVLSAHLFLAERAIIFRSQHRHTVFLPKYWYIMDIRHKNWKTSMCTRLPLTLATPKKQFSKLVLL